VGNVVVGEAVPAAAAVGGAGHDRSAAGGAGRPVARRVRRWRDLDRRNRGWALAVGAALLLAPLVAFAWFTPDWSPQGDPALMALRALDTGTSRTPLLGQPSQSLVYADGVAPVHHPGPLHFYLLALPVRVLGGALGMSLVSVAITGSCLVTAAWAVFRQLGRTAGVVAAAALAAVAFTTGAGSLINPVSSVIAGYPLLVSAVLLWCVACGDVRLLPLATAAVSFTAQQHLSVVAATGIMTVGALAVLAYTWRREGRGSDPAARRELRRWGGLSVALALVLWAPVLLQQAFGGAGNLGQMVWFARHGNDDTLGYTTALWQLAHTLGLPPLLGQTAVGGAWLNTRPSAVTWVSAAAVAAVVTGVCLWRASDPRRVRLGVMAGVVAVAGLVNGASVPVGIEQHRVAFYHWTFVLAFFVAVVVGLAVADLLRRALGGRRPLPAAALGGLAVVVIALPSLVNPTLDRPSNRIWAAYVPLDRDIVEYLADAVSAHAGELGDHPLIIQRNVPTFELYGETLAFELVERGIDLRFPLTSRFFVHDDRLVDRDELDGGLVLVVDEEMPSDTPDGELVATADLRPGLDVDSYRVLVAQAREGDEVRLGSSATETLSSAEELFAGVVLEGVLDDPEAGLLRPDVLAFLADHPEIEEPALDPELVGRVLASIEASGGEWRPGTPTGLRLFLVDREQMLGIATRHEIGRVHS
jgi:hypothetical protein